MRTEHPGGMSYGHEGAGTARRDVFGQLVRFGMVGCSNTLLSWCAYVLLVWAGVRVLWASGIAWTLGALNSCVQNRRWTFRSRGRHAPELVRFGAVQCAGLALDVLLLHTLTRDAGVGELVAQALVYPATVVAFLLSRQWAFAPVGPVGRWRA
jgi:putative flippase GtrA